MCSDREMHDVPPLVCQHQKPVQDLEPNRRHNDEVRRDQCLQVLSNVLQVCEGGLQCRTMYFADMFAAMGTDSRLRIMRALLSAHPDGMVSATSVMSGESPPRRSRTISKNSTTKNWSR